MMMEIRFTSAAGAEFTPTPSPVMAPTNAANPSHRAPPKDASANCPVGIVAILPDDKAQQLGSTAREFSAFLWSPDGPGVSTGTIWVNASGSAYEVPFTQRKVLSPSLSDEVDAVTFRLPATAHLENAFVARLAGANSSESAPCSIFNPWVPSFNVSLSPARVARLRNAKSIVPAIDAEPVAVPENACQSAIAEVTTLRNSPVAYPVRPPAPGFLVNVAVSLNADSSIEGATVTSPPRSGFDAAALASANASLYRTRIVNCRPVKATYIYVVEFDP